MLPNEPDFPDLRSVMDLSWENGLKQVQFEKYETKVEHAYNICEKSPQNLDILSQTADLNDQITLLTPFEGRTTFNADLNFYKYTLDRFLLDYYDYMQYKNRDKKVQIPLDSTAQESLINYLNRPQNERKRTFIKLDYLRQHKEKNNGREEYFLIGGDAAVYTNLFNWYHVSGVKIKRPANPLALYGVPYRQANAVLSGSFHLENYILHELLTNVSLVLEITAILLEFDNTEIRNKAWHTFLETPYDADPYRSTDDEKISENFPTMFDIVFGSDLLYTRIAVARSFFRTILIATKLKKYVPYLSGDDRLFLDVEWDMLVHDACHAESLLHYYFPERNPQNPNDCNESLAHLTSLLSNVISPASSTGPKLLLLCFNGPTMIFLRDARLLCIMTQNIKKEGSEHPT